VKLGEGIISVYSKPEGLEQEINNNKDLGTSVE